MDVASLELCDRTRVRKNRPSIDSDVVEEYAEAYKCGLIVEPLDVFRESGTERYVVADGEHRLLALQRAKVKVADCRIHEGDEVAALDFAIGCNHAHGLRRSKADKYHAFERIMETTLKDTYRTDTDLSEKIGVSKATIARYKVDWRNSESADKQTRRKKQDAKESAERKTRNDLEPRAKVNGEKHEAVSKRDTESKIEKPTWTPEDQHGYDLLKSAWRHSSSTARARFLSEVS